VATRFLTKRDVIRIAKARLTEIYALHAEGKLEFEELRQDSLRTLGALVTKPVFDRTSVMAVREVLARTDPVEKDGGTGPLTAIAVTIVRELPANGNHPRTALPASGVIVHREGGNGDGA